MLRRNSTSKNNHAPDSDNTVNGTSQSGPLSSSVDAFDNMDDDNLSVDSKKSKGKVSKLKKIFGGNPKKDKKTPVKPRKEEELSERSLQSDKPPLSIARAPKSQIVQAKRTTPPRAPQNGLTSTFGSPNVAKRDSFGSNCSDNFSPPHFGEDTFGQFDGFAAPDFGKSPFEMNQDPFAAFPDQSSNSLGFSSPQRHPYVEANFSDPWGSSPIRPPTWANAKTNNNNSSNTNGQKMLTLPAPPVQQLDPEKDMSSESESDAFSDPYQKPLESGNQGFRPVSAGLMSKTGVIHNNVFETSSSSFKPANLHKAAFAGSFATISVDEEDPVHKFFEQDRPPLNSEDEGSVATSGNEVLSSSQPPTLDSVLAAMGHPPSVTSVAASEGVSIVAYTNQSESASNRFGLFFEGGPAFDQKNSVANVKRRMAEKARMRTQGRAKENLQHAGNQERLQQETLSEAMRRLQAEKEEAQRMKDADELEEGTNERARKERMARGPTYAEGSVFVEDECRRLQEAEHLRIEKEVQHMQFEEAERAAEEAERIRLVEERTRKQWEEDKQRLAAEEQRRIELEAKEAIRRAEERKRLELEAERKRIKEEEERARIEWELEKQRHLELQHQEEERLRLELEEEQHRLLERRLELEAERKQLEEEKRLQRLAEAKRIEEERRLRELEKERKRLEEEERSRKQWELERQQRLEQQIKEEEERRRAIEAERKRLEEEQLAWEMKCRAEEQQRREQEEHEKEQERRRIELEAAARLQREREEKLREEEEKRLRLEEEQRIRFLEEQRKAAQEQRRLEKIAERREVERLRLIEQERNCKLKAEQQQQER